MPTPITNATSYVTTNSVAASGQPAVLDPIPPRVIPRIVIDATAGQRLHMDAIVREFTAIAQAQADNPPAGVPAAKLRLRTVYTRDREQRGVCYEALERGDGKNIIYKVFRGETLLRCAARQYDAAGALQVDVQDSNGDNRADRALRLESEQRGDVSVERVFVDENGDGVVDRVRQFQSEHGSGRTLCAEDINADGLFDLVERYSYDAQGELVITREGSDRFPKLRPDQIDPRWSADEAAIRCGDTAQELEARDPYGFLRLSRSGELEVVDIVGSRREACDDHVNVIARAVLFARANDALYRLARTSQNRIEVCKNLVLALDSDLGRVLGVSWRTLSQNGKATLVDHLWSHIPGDSRGPRTFYRDFEAFERVLARALARAQYGDTGDGSDPLPVTPAASPLSASQAEARRLEYEARGFAYLLVQAGNARWLGRGEDPTQHRFAIDVDVGEFASLSPKIVREGAGVQGTVELILIETRTERGQPALTNEQRVTLSPPNGRHVFLTDRVEAGVQFDYELQAELPSGERVSYHAPFRAPATIR
jgi:hypothetical protein